MPAERRRDHIRAVDLEGVQHVSRLAEGFSEHDPSRQLIQAHCGPFSHAAPILRAASEAAGDPDVAGLAAAGDAHRREVIEELVRGWAAAGALSRGLSVRDACDRMWLLTTVDAFLAATDHLGWRAGRHAGWRDRLLRRDILGDAQ